MSVSRRGFFGLLAGAVVTPKGIGAVDPAPVKPLDLLRASDLPSSLMVSKHLFYVDANGKTTRVGAFRG